MDFIDLKAQQIKIRSLINERIQNVLDHGKYIQGPEVFELEEKLSEYNKVKYCISCSSGTDALLIPLLAKNIGPGDAVITTPFTYIATAEVISLLGAEPVFCDIYPETFNLNPLKIKEAYEYAIHKGLKPKAIIPVDLFGLPARYRLIKEIARELDLFILEDAAQGFGGQIRGQRSSSFGHVSTTSFFPAKPLGCYGDGGAIFTDDEDLASKIKSIRVHGGGEDKYENIRIGVNGRLDTIQAAILIEKLKIFDQEIQSRNKKAEYYSLNIEESLKVPFVPSGYLSSWAQYSLVSKSNNERERYLKKLKKQEIPAMVYYKIPLHLQRVYQKLGYQKGDFPIAEQVSRRIFSIPFHPYISKEDQDRIIEELNQ